MKRSELKEILRPIVRELIRESLKESLRESLQESLLSSGLLSSVISEVMSGLSASGLSMSAPSVLREQQSSASSIPKLQDDRDERMRERLEEQKNQRRKLLDSVGFQAQDGTNPFTGTQPLHESAAPISDNPSSVPLPTAGIDPSDSGIDISKFLGNRKFNIKE